MVLSLLECRWGAIASRGWATSGDWQLAKPRIPPRNAETRWGKPAGLCADGHLAVASQVGGGDRIMAELYADPIQKAHLSDPKRAVYPIQRAFLRLKWDSGIVANPTKKATCVIRKWLSEWRRRERATRQSEIVATSYFSLCCVSFRRWRYRIWSSLSDHSGHQSDHGQS